MLWGNTPCGTGHTVGITMLIFAALGVLSAVKNRGDQWCKNVEHCFLTGETWQWNTAMSVMIIITHMYIDM